MEILDLETVMTHQTGAHDGRIVVGVDGSSHSKAALRWAVTQARRTGVRVEATSAWQQPATVGYPYGWSPDIHVGDIVAIVAEKVLADAVAEVVAQQDEPVEIRTTVVHGRPAEVLLEAAVGAQMLVVGSRGHGTYAEILLGSVSRQCVQHAPCPVLVMPRNPAPSPSPSTRQPVRPPRSRPEPTARAAATAHCQ
jgi:nucleotide-binding universal stress UspA family protein